jgi:hypothetical protein
VPQDFNDEDKSALHLAIDAEFDAEFYMNTIVPYLQDPLTELNEIGFRKVCCF